MSARLVGWVRSRGRISLPITKMVRLGAAADNDLVLPVEDVSRAHARILGLDDGYWIEDAGSRNGTSVNGRRVTRSKLKHLDVITLGRRTDVIFLQADAGTSSGVLPGATVNASLEWLDGPEAGASVPLGRGELVIGRGEASAIVIDNPAVSRSHAWVTVTGTEVAVEDLGSANGTRLNGRPLTMRTPLRDGDEIEVGAVRRLRVRIVTAVAAGATPAAETRLADSSWRTRLMFAGELPPMPDLPGLDAQLALASGRLASSPPATAADRSGDPSRVGTVRRAAPTAMAPPPIPDQTPEAPVEAPRTVIAAPGAFPVPSGLLGEDGASRIPAAATLGGGYDIGPPPPEVATDPSGADRTVYSRETPPLVRAVQGMRLRGKRGVFTLPLGRSTVGRAPDVTVRIDCREISRVHAAILVEPSGASVEDQGSANGTTVNGKAAPGVQSLADGDRVAFGSVEFAIELLRTGGAE